MALQLSLDSVFIAATGHVSSDLVGETVILIMSSGMYYGLHSIGTAIWGEMAQPNRVTEICDSLVQKFDVDKERCSEDVLQLLERLLAAGLITVDAGTPGRE